MQPFVTVEELAQHFKVSVSTLRAWIRNGHIPTDTYLKIGSTYRFCLEDVSNAMKKADQGEDKDHSIFTELNVDEDV